MSQLSLLDADQDAAARQMLRVLHALRDKHLPAVAGVRPRPKPGTDLALVVAAIEVAEAAGFGDAPLPCERPAAPAEQRDSKRARPQARKPSPRRVSAVSGPLDPKDKLVTLSAAAAMMRVTERTIYRWAHVGAIRTIQGPERQRLYALRDLEAIKAGL